MCNRLADSYLLLNFLHAKVDEGQKGHSVRSCYCENFTNVLLLQKCA